MSNIQSGPFIVTGASGQLGRHVVDLLVQEGAGPVIAISWSLVQESAGRGGEGAADDERSASGAAGVVSGAGSCALLSIVAAASRRLQHRVVICFTVGLEGYPTSSGIGACSLSTR